MTNTTSKIAKITPVKGVISRQGLTVKEMSLTLGGESAGWSGKKIRRLIRQGKVSATKNIGRWFFDASQVKALTALAQGKTK